MTTPDDMIDNINMADIRCGDRFWECEGGHNCELEALADSLPRAIALAALKAREEKPDA